MSWSVSPKPSESKVASMYISTSRVLGIHSRSPRCQPIPSCPGESTDQTPLPSPREPHRCLASRSTSKPKIEENSDSSGKSKRTAPCRWSGRGQNGLQLVAVPDASGVESGLTSSRPRPGRSATSEGGCFGNAKANMGCSMAVANAQTSPDSRRRPI